MEELTPLEKAEMGTPPEGKLEGTVSLKDLVNRVTQARYARLYADIKAMSELTMELGPDFQVDVSVALEDAADYLFSLAKDDMIDLLAPKEDLVWLGLSIATERDRDGDYPLHERGTNA